MTTNNVANYATGASGTVLTGNGVGVTPTFQAAAAGAGRLLKVQYFTASATYTPTAGTNNILIESWGGGGGGASQAAPTASAGGGGGAYVKALISNTTSQSVVIGAGGTGAVANAGSTATDGGNTTFGSTILVAAGGSHGLNVGTGGAGGAVVNCTVPAGGFAMPGGPGGSTPNIVSLSVVGGSAFGNLSAQSNDAVFGFPGIANTGQGGSGGTSTVDGGAGGTGLMIIYEYS